MAVPDASGVITNNHPSEITLLLPQNNNSNSASWLESLKERINKNLTRQHAWLAVGNIGATLAQLTQPLEGAMGMDGVILKVMHHASDLRTVLRVVGVLAGAIGAYNAIRAVSLFYASMTFAAIGKEGFIKWLKGIFNFKEYTLVDWLTILPALMIVPPMAMTFGGLAFFAADEFADYLDQNLKYSFVHTIAQHFFRSSYPAGIVGISSLLIGLLGLGNVVKGGVQSIYDVIYYCLENPAYRARSEKIYLELESLRMLWKRLMENEVLPYGHYGKANALIAEILDDNSIDLEKIIEAKEIDQLIERINSKLKSLNNDDIVRLLQFSVSRLPEEAKPLPETYKEFILSKGLSAGAVVGAAIGFLNFPDLARHYIFDKIPYLNRISLELSILDYTGMVLLANGMRKDLEITILNIIFGKMPDINVLPHWENFKLVFKAILWSTLSVLPNVFQAMEAEQSPVLAALSLLIQYFALYKLGKQAVLEKAFENDPVKKLAVTGNTFFTGVTQAARKDAQSVNDFYIKIKKEEVIIEISDDEELDNSDTNSKDSHIIDMFLVEEPVPQYWPTRAINACYSCVSSFWYSKPSDYNRSNNHPSQLPVNTL